MSLSFKQPQGLSPVLGALQVPNSAYGQCIPVPYGRVRIPQKLIYASQFKAIGTGKFGKSANANYSANGNFLFGFGPIEAIGATWVNGIWKSVQYQNQTFTPTGTNTTWNLTVTPTAAFVAIAGVQVIVSVSGSVNDYAGYGLTRSVNFAGGGLLPLYNNQYPAPNYNSWSNSGLPYAVYNTTWPATTSVQVVFPSAVTNPTIQVLYMVVGLSAGASNTPTASFEAFDFEQELGSSGLSGNPQSWIEFSGIAFEELFCGPTPVMPAMNFEVKGLYGMGSQMSASTFDPTTGGFLAQPDASGDCCPADIIIDIICSGNRNFSSGLIWQHGLNLTQAPTTLAYNYSALQWSYSRYAGVLADEGGPAYSGLGLTSLRNYCMTYGIFISGTLDSQQKAADVLDDLCEIANCAPVWDGGSLSFIPYCECSTAAHLVPGSYYGGSTYTAPTSGGPSFALTSANLIPYDDGSLWQVDYSRPDENYNSLQVGYRDATQEYNDNFVLISDGADIAVQDQRPSPQKNFRNWITDGPTATAVGWALLHRQLLIKRQTYSFKLPAYWESILTPMDLVTLYDPNINPYAVPVRITSIAIRFDKESGKRQMQCTAEPFIYGGSLPIAPAGIGSPGSSGGTVLGGQDPGSVNAPFILESVPALNPATPQLWLCVSGSGQYYAGCYVWLSVDGGASYGSAPIGIINGNQTMGVVYNSNYPNSSNPDNTDTLYVDLTESGGILSSVNSSGQAALASLWALAGGGTLVVNGQTLTIPYELGAYQGVGLMSTNKYSLGPPNLRGQDVTPTAAHNIGSQFSFLNDGHVFKMNLSESMIGVTLYFKFQAFSADGQTVQQLSACTAYSFTPTGLVGWTYNSSGTGGNNTTGTNPVPNANDLYLYVPGTYSSSQEIWSAEPARNVTLPAGLTNSPTPTCDVAPTGSVTLTINKVSGGVTTAVGSIQFAASSRTGTVTFASAVTLNGTGDYLTVVAPSTPDATFAGLRFTFWCTRSN